MSIFDKEGNKSYKEYKISDDSRNKITKGIRDAINDNPAAFNSELENRRIEKMKKEKIYFDFMKKVCVASVSLLATGAIVFGVANYNEKNGNSKSAKDKTTVEVSTENIDKTNEDEYVNLFKDYSEKSIKSKFFDTGIAQVEVGDLVFEAEATNMENPSLLMQNKMWLSLKDKKTGKIRELKNLYFDTESNVYTNGTYIISKCVAYIYKYDIAADKLEMVDITKEENLLENRDIKKIGKYTGMRETFIKNGVMYCEACRMIDGMISGFDLLGYNIKTNKVSLEIENYSRAYTDYEDYTVVQYKNSYDEFVLSIFKCSLEGLIDEKEVGTGIELCDDAMGIGSKIYYTKITETGKEEKLYEEDDEATIKPIKKLKLYSYDMKSSKEKELTEVDIKEFGKDAYGISMIYSPNDDWCKVYIDYDKIDTPTIYKYTYATKKFEKIEN